MATEKVVHRNIPFPRKFEPLKISIAYGLVRNEDLPVTRVPPVRVEMPIGEASNLCKCSKNILEDDEETDKECHHEREQKLAYGLSEDKTHLSPTVNPFQS